MRTTRRLNRTAALIIGTVSMFGAASGWTGASDAVHTRPRSERGTAERPAAPRPQARPLPQSLHVSVPEGRTAARRGAAPATPPRLVRLHRHAEQAAAWAAHEVSRNAGLREYRRIGFHEGMRVAMSDESLGRWDFREGVRAGRADREARRAGRSAGTAAASEAAREPAWDRVKRQFMDLTREPRYAPAPEVPGYAPDETWMPAPVLSEVFADLPVEASARFSGRFDSWTLYRCREYGEFHDAGWRSPERAFDLWLSDRRRSRYFRELRGDEPRARFRATFREAFLRALPVEFERSVLPAYHRGFDHGWDYGASVAYEWNYRQGYAEGFRRAASAAARGSFADAYPGAYVHQYDLAFDDWSNNAVPGIVDLAVRDAGDDGVIQPGEEIYVEYELANYGGRAGEFRIRIDGSDLAGARESDVTLPRRGIVRSSPSMSAWVRPETANRTSSEVRLSIGGRTRSAPFQVRWPLEFFGRTDLERVDTLGGSGLVMVSVRNISRRAVDAAVDLARVRGYRIGGTRDLGILRAGETGSARFELDGIRPIDIISGNLRLEFEARRDGTVHDRIGFSFPDLATDLESRDLVRYMLLLAGHLPATEREIAEARSQVLRRIEADWRRAAQGAGNPYRTDLKRGSRRTALGELVQVWQIGRRGLIRPEVFAGLGSEIEALSGDLPGVHPLLRRSLRKLARRLG